MTRRVFLSHTSEFSTYPKGESFVKAAIDAVNRAGCAPCDMGHFTARDQQPAQYCIDRVRECDVYIGIIGLRYGSPVRDRPKVSYTELEFEAASIAPAKTRLIFLLEPDAEVPASSFNDRKYVKRQDKFRERLQDAGVTCKPFSKADELKTFILQALLEGSTGSEKKSIGQERIPWPEGTSPYPGLFSFDIDYAPLFFGRDREVDAVLAKMSQAAGRFLVISGASGSGKSSLVAAGIRRAVNEGRLTGANKVMWLQIQPGRGQTPFESLTWPLTEAFRRISARPGELASQLANDTQTIGRLIDAHLSQGQELILLIDQLEELFTSGFKDRDVTHFLEALVTASRAATSRLRVIGTVRSEFITRLQESEVVLDALNGGGSHFLGPMSPKSLHEMIEKPAQATGYDFEPGLVDELLREAAQEPGNLPLLAYAMNQLFVQLKAGGRTFTHEAYKKIGRVAGAIGTQADHGLQRLDSDVDAAFGRVFAELVHIERDRPPTRKRASLSQFKDDEEAGKVIQVLSGPECRVVVTAGEGQESTVEVAHEKLFMAWPKLMDWIDKSGEALRDIEHAEEEAQRWQKGGNNPQELWLGSRAKKVLAAIERFGKRPSPKLGRFLKPQKVLRAKLTHDDISHQERLLIGQKLAEFGDTRPGVGLTKDGLPDIEWIQIPGGKVSLEETKHVFKVKPFRIAKYPVTHAQFKAFLDAEDGFQNKKWWKDIEQSSEAHKPSWEEANAPRETVSWYEAVAFCRWLSAKTGKGIRLPTEWEWQQAATGGDPTREYPWEGGWDAVRCNSYESRVNRTTAVGMYPQGATQQDVLDMAGNVWEWCLNTYEEQDESITTDGRRVIRGGSWLNLPKSLRTSNRDWNDAAYRFKYIGFRLAQDREP